jgi:protein phosphatase PTC7
MCADDDDFDSPYIQAAREDGMDIPWWEKLVTAKFKDGKFKLGQMTGGKLDDITVVVARVTTKTQEPEPAAASIGSDQGATSGG